MYLNNLRYWSGIQFSINNYVLLNTLTGSSDQVNANQDLWLSANNPGTDFTHTHTHNVSFCICVTDTLKGWAQKMPVNSWIWRPISLSWEPDDTVFCPPDWPTDADDKWLKLTHPWTGQDGQLGFARSFPANEKLSSTDCSKCYVG